jgi:hypothetical protein
MSSSLDHSITLWLPLFLSGIVLTAFFDGDSMMQYMQRPLAWFLSAMLLLMPMMSAQAAMIGTDQIINQTDSSLTREKLQQFLDREATRKQLHAWGVSPDWIKERVNNLTDMELARINRDINDLNAGGESILGVLLIIFLVFVITDIIGATNIFSFIRPVN